MNTVFKITVLAIISLFPEICFSQDETALYEDICGIRKMFCGGAAFALAAATVTGIGYLVFIGKAKWPTVIVTVAGLTIFLGAENLVQNIVTPPPGSDVVDVCSCS